MSQINEDFSRLKIYTIYNMFQINDIIRETNYLSSGPTYRILGFSEGIPCNFYTVERYEQNQGSFTLSATFVHKIFTKIGSHGGETNIKIKGSGKRHPLTSIFKNE